MTLWLGEFNDDYFARLTSNPPRSGCRARTTAPATTRCFRTGLGRSAATGPLSPRLIAVPGHVHRAQLGGDGKAARPAGGGVSRATTGSSVASSAILRGPEDFARKLGEVFDEVG